MKIPTGYACPLCPGHQDDEFVPSQVVGSPICIGCAVELSVFLEEDERRDDPVLDRLEQLTGRTFHELRVDHLRESASEFSRRLLPHNVEREAREQMRQTGQSLDEVVAHWRQLVTFYQEELGRAVAAIESQES
jgi:hypothetical protein